MAAQSPLLYLLGQNMYPTGVLGSVFLEANPKSVLVFLSYYSLTSVTNVTLFLLWGDIVFKVNLDDAVKSIHCAEVCSSWNFSINSWMLFQYINHNALSNTL